jgi:hypothetical protein
MERHPVPGDQVETHISRHLQQKLQVGSSQAQARAAKFSLLEFVLKWRAL